MSSRLWSVVLIGGMLCAGALQSEMLPKFTNLSVKQGLSQNSIWAILRDKQGFFWFGTDDGLNKYDGYRFLVYRNIKYDSTTHIQNAVRALMQDKAGYIWIGTSTGVSILDPVTNRFLPLFTEGEAPEAIRTGLISSIIEDRDGSVWIGTVSKGLYRIDPSRRTHRRFIHRSGDSTSLSSDYTTSVYADRGGRIWIGTVGAGINRFEPHTQSFRVFRKCPGEPSSLIENTVTSFYEDTKGRFWIGTKSLGLAQFDRSTGRCRLYPSYAAIDESSTDPLTIYSIIEDATGRIVYGTYGAGVRFLDPSTGQITSWFNDIRDQKSLAGNEVLSLYRDDTDNLWIGTYSNGLSKYDAQSEHFQVFRNENPRPDLLFSNNIRSLFRDKTGSIWVGTPLGLNILDPATGTCESYRIHRGSNAGGRNYIRSFYQDRRGVMWIGTRIGATTFDRRTKRFTPFSSSDPRAEDALRSDIRMMMEDRQGLLWFATSRGVCTYDRKTNRFVVYRYSKTDSSTISNDNTRAILEDHHGIIWIATYGGGINKFDRATGRFTRLEYDPENPSGLGNNNAAPIAEDREGNLWIGTYGAGLNKYDPHTGRFTRLTEADGLANNTIFGILADHRDQLWISTYSGISRLDLATLRFRNYTSASGLQSEEFNLNCSFLDNDGTMLFGGHDGFNMFHPDRIRDNASLPPVYITSMSVFNKPLRPDTVMEMKHRIELSHDENSFSFDFVALNFRKSELNRYKYKLEGFDTEWSPSGAERKASYTNILPGEYVFRVIGSNNDDVWNTTGASVSIVIHPPFWRTWWAYGLYVIGLALCVYGTVTYLRRRQRTALFIERQRNEKERLERINAEIGQERILLRTVIDNIPMAVYAKDAQARRVITNAVDIATINKPEHDVLGRTDLEVLPAEIAERSIADDRSVIQTGHSVIDREELVMNAAGERRWLLTSKIPWRDKNGTIVGLVGIGLDITERKRLEQQLLQSQKLEGVGTLAGGIAHDFNNLLAMVLGSAELLQRQLADHPELKKYVDRIIEASERGTSISRQLLIFSRPDQAELKPISLSHAITELQEMLKHFLPKSINIETKIDTEGDDIFMGDAGQIHQALLNLALNGSDAMKNIGRLTITKRAVGPEDLRRLFAAEMEGRYVAVSVSDTGVGMDENVIRRIFDPFFTTKPPGKGTGLGLGIVHGIVKNHNGLIHIDSTPGMGTTIGLYFPAVPRKHTDAIVPHTESVASSGGTILVVDDEPLLREMLGEFLTESGYTILEARDGFEALEVYGTHRSAIDLVITDLGMPKMGGEELFRKLRAIDPKAKVIVSSGYLDGTTKDTLLQMGVSQVLIKPFRMQEIRSSIHAVFTPDAGQ